MDGNPQDHVLSYSKLALVLAALIGLTSITVMVSRIDLGILNIWIAILIASLKSSLVLMFFMHLKYESRLVRISVIGTIFCLAILIGFIFWDISFR
ncbi:MAG: cytochrome C oxidase subunit IV family protein [Deltaproteobacteria bacterium]|jgi:cytochrome c oxidase subunit IV|nr:cytochrome C oxidase subunit IV family protein [Deltaproteobacteria bacterium]